jgi:cell division protein FtsI/penicillin-binding protein 2
MYRLLLAAAASVAMLSGLGACSLTSGGSADEAAEELASALAGGSLDGVEVTSDADRERYATAVRNITEVPIEVAVEDVDERDASATVTLAWEWDLGTAEWVYETAVEMKDNAGTWEVDWEPDALVPGLEPGEVLDVDVLTGRRGEILGQDGLALVTERSVYRYGLNKATTQPRRWEASATRIARAVGVDVAAYRSKVRSYGDEAFVEAIVLRSDDATSGVDPSYADIPGSDVIEDEIPLAPTKQFAAPVLGAVGPATAEMVEESGGTVEAGDEVGLSGLQARYDDDLRGVPGVRVQAVDTGGVERTLFDEGVRNGKDLRTTLDLELQLKAEQVLAAHVASDGPDSALVAVRPSTGEVVVAANGPANDGFNAATAGQYPPGSTFKVVTALALLRSGMTPEDVVECGATTLVDGRSFKNYDDYPSAGLGSITLTEAIANSCNTALINARDLQDDDTLASAAAALGLGIDHDLGFPAYFGQAPPPTGETEKAADQIGQGKILASPLTMATVAASVASGKAVLPMLLTEHKVDQEQPAAPLTTDEAEQLRAMMRAVVTQGSATFLSGLPGEVGAKTGTAEYGEPTADGSLATHTWMIATQGDLAVAVFVETGESGSQTAGPILEDFLA